MLAFFMNLSLMEFQVRCLTLLHLFSVINSFKWFWMGGHNTNILLMVEFLRAPLLVQHFSCYILMTFLMILLVILLSMLMILPSTHHWNPLNVLLEKGEINLKRGGGVDVEMWGVAIFLLLYSLILFTVYVGKVKLPLLLFGSSVF